VELAGNIGTKKWFSWSND